MSAHEYYVFKVLIGHNWAGFYWIFVQRDIQKVGSDIGDSLPQAATVWWYFTSAAPTAFICVFAAFFFTLLQTVVTVNSQEWKQLRFFLSGYIGSVYCLLRTFYDT